MRSPKPFLKNIANRLGLHGLERHRSQQISKKIIELSDLIIVMEIGHKEALRNEFHSSQKRIFLLSEIAEGIPYDIADPLTPNVDPDDTADKIDELIKKGFNRIVEAAEYFERTRRIN